MSKQINLDQRDMKAELTMLARMEELPSAGAQRDFAWKIGLEWEEYLRLKRKYKMVLKRYREKKNGGH